MISGHSFTPGDDWSPNACQWRRGNKPACGADLMQHERMLVGVPTGRITYPPAGDVFTHQTRLPGITVAVQGDGRLVLRVLAFGDFDLGALDGFVADLELARAHRRRVEMYPVRYGAGTAREQVIVRAPVHAPDDPCCEDHDPDGEAEACCTDCPDALPLTIVDTADGLSWPEYSQAKDRGYTGPLRAETIQPTGDIL